jgi:uncharacterized protein (DUF1800 family)
MLKALLAALASVVALVANAAAIGEEGARHLLGRAGFGASPAEVAAYAPLDRTEAVDRLLAGTHREAGLAPPAFVAEPFQPYYRLRGLDAEARMAAQKALFQQGLALREWWLREMILTDSPLTERMTLFWHNHFATSQQKVRSSQLMYRQNTLLRREALGNFARLLHAMARDPAMLVWLDNAGNRKQAPNENFAREVMELFTLGEGHYTEQDVKEAARAFTGMSLDRDTGEYRWRPMWHDGGEKTVLGKTGRFDGDDVIDILLARPETAEFLTTKLWLELVSPTPDPAEVKRLAAAWRASGYEMKPLVRALLLDEAFWAAGSRERLVKSPVDLVAGTMRTYEMRPMDLRPAVIACAALGQNLFGPPNVKGWPGGERWIDASTLLGRKQWLERTFRGGDNLAAMRTMDDYEARAERAREWVSDARYQLK